MNYTLTQLSPILKKIHYTPLTSSNKFKGFFKIKNHKHLSTRQNNFLVINRFNSSAHFTASQNLFLKNKPAISCPGKEELRKLRNKFTNNLLPLKIKHTHGSTDIFIDCDLSIPLDPCYQNDIGFKWLQDVGILPQEETNNTLPQEIQFKIKKLKQTNISLLGAFLLPNNTSYTSYKLITTLNAWLFVNDDIFDKLPYELNTEPALSTILNALKQSFYNKEKITTHFFPLSSQNKQIIQGLLNGIYDIRCQIDELLKNYPEEQKKQTIGHIKHALKNYIDGNIDQCILSSENYCNLKDYLKNNDITIGSSIVFDKKISKIECVLKKEKKLIIKTLNGTITIDGSKAFIYNNNQQKTVIDTNYKNIFIKINKKEVSRKKNKITLSNFMLNKRYNTGAMDLMYEVGFCALGIYISNHIRENKTWLECVKLSQQHICTFNDIVSREKEEKEKLFHTNLCLIYEANFNMYPSESIIRASEEVNGLLHEFNRNVDRCLTILRNKNITNIENELKNVELSTKFFYQWIHGHIMWEVLSPKGRHVKNSLV